MAGGIVVYGWKHTASQVLGNGRALEAAGVHVAEYRELPCLGALDPLLVMRALDEGFDRVVAVGCYVGRCRHLTGSQRAGRAMTHVGDVLEEVGLDRHRVGIVMGSPIDPRGLLEGLRDFISGPEGDVE